MLISNNIPYYKRKLRKRIICLIVISFFTVGFSIILIKIFSENISFFLTPSELREKLQNEKEKISKVELKLGGIVKENSLRYQDNIFYFNITDNNYTITVKYSGMLPSLFKEGQSAVVLGKFKDDIFVAKEVLAKHDENYKPLNSKIN